jgi:hypothetical protein
MGENSETSADTPDDEHVIKGASDEPDADTSTDTNDITASDAGGDTNTDTIPPIPIPIPISTPIFTHTTRLIFTHQIPQLAQAKMRRLL